MVLNPLNASICQGEGLGIDSVGRPRWRVDVAGSAASPAVSREGHEGLSAFYVTTVVLPITNTTTQNRTLLAQFSSAHVYLHARSGGYPSPLATWIWGIGPGLTSGTASAGEASAEGITSVRFKFPGPEKTVLWAFGAGVTMNLAFNLIAQGQAPGLYDVYSPGLNITSWWLGGT